MEAPPPFQEAPRCDVCKCSFTAFRRRHHCRCCGRTLCSEHSSNQMALPQFGIYSSVRVCEDCFNNPSRHGEVRPINSISSVINEISSLNMDENDAPEAKSISRDDLVIVHECKCGMPLCICKPLTPDPVPLQNSSVSSSHYNPRPKKPSSNQRTAESISRNPSSSSSSNTKPSSSLNIGQAINGIAEKPKADYGSNGEGLREAIKNSDPVGVKKLLSEGVNANYCDKQGMTPLHLAAVFNQTEIAFILMNHGASLDRKNAQGETPLDCAPAMLQYKMRQKMEGELADPNRE